jgi:hypothetical protein
MRLLIAALSFVFLTVSAFAQDVYVHGYTRSNGTYVAPHMRSAPDGNPYNNWSTQGNVNPYTGSVGTHNPNSGYGSSYGSSGYGSQNYPNPYGSGINTQPLGQ